MRLYDIAEQYTDIIELLEQGENAEVLQSMLDGLEDAFDNKVESIVKLIRSKAAERDAITEEVRRLSERATRINKDVEWLETYIKTQMIRTERDKIKSSLFSISLVNNPPSVGIIDESSIPPEYINTKLVKSIDKRIILDQLKAGFEIPGAEIKQERRLSIR